MEPTQNCALTKQDGNLSNKDEDISSTNMEILSRIMGT
jgi:hypothetical protein